MKQHIAILLSIFLSACGGHFGRDPNIGLSKQMLSKARHIDARQVSKKVRAFLNVAWTHRTTPYAPIALQQAVQLAIHAERTTVHQWLGAELLKLSQNKDELGAESLWLYARLQVDGVGDYAEARRSLRQLYRRYGDSPRRDNALWYLADIYRAIGAWKHAHKTYAILAQHRVERGWFIGSLRSPYTAKAALFKADIEAYVFLDYASAIRSYRSFVSRFRDSTLVDDALISMAACYLKSDQIEKGRAVLEDLGTRPLTAKQSTYHGFLNSFSGGDIPIPDRIYSSVSPRPRRLQ